MLGMSVLVLPCTDFMFLNKSVQFQLGCLIITVELIRAINISYSISYNITYMFDD